MKDWAVDGHSWVDERVANATAYIEKNVKQILLKSYISSGGRFDVESLKIDLTKYVADKKALTDVAEQMARASLG